LQYSIRHGAATTSDVDVVGFPQIFYLVYLFGVGAHDENRRISGQLVESLKPHLEPRDVTSEEMMRAVVQLESRQIDDKNKQIDVHLSFE
jgi:Fe-S-cluster formation regulator IscX/YfhJ